MTEYNYAETLDSIKAIANIVCGYTADGRDANRNYVGRSWFRVLYYKHDRQYHPAVLEAVKYGPPKHLGLLVLEFPHRAVTAPDRLAYTRDERAGIADKQTLTSVGKYLARHFDLPDHIVRDIVARHVCKSEFRFVRDVHAMVHAVNNGPNSCMKWRKDQFVACDDGISRHPYETYDPKYGWHMAVRYEGDEIVGRALCVEDKDGDDELYWVRSFKRTDNGYSPSDEFLEAWLKTQGYTKRSCYADGQRMAYYIAYRCASEPIAPYIDGDVRTVRIAHDQSCLIIESDEDEAHYKCDNTDGSADDVDGEECDSCGRRCRSSEDMYWVGRGEDEHVCSGCIDDYTYVYGRRGNQYYIPNDDVVCVNDECYDPDYLSDNDIVELENGDYEHLDNAVFIESEDAYYHVDSDRIVQDLHNEYQLLDNCVELESGEYALEDECWQCQSTLDWFHEDDIDPVIVDGETYHPDYAPEGATDDTDDTDDTDKPDADNASEAAANVHTS